MNSVEREICLSLSEGPKSFWRLFTDQEGTFYEFYDSIKKLEKSGVIEVKDKKIKLIKNIFNGLENYENTCSTCDGKMFSFDPKFQKLFEKYKSIVESRPKISGDYNQLYMYPMHSMLRASMMTERKSLQNNSILVLGDDDLVSIAIGLTKLCKEIVVLEIDQRLVDFINSIASKENLPIKAYQYNAEDLFPDQFKRKFDVFVTEPPETSIGLELFLSRCVESLKENGSGYFGITTVETTKKGWFELQKKLTKMNLVTYEIVKNFSIYSSMSAYIGNKLDVSIFIEDINESVDDFFNKFGKPDSEYYSSCFVRVKSIGVSEPIVKEKTNFGKLLFESGL